MMNKVRNNDVLRIYAVFAGDISLEQHYYYTHYSLYIILYSTIYNIYCIQCGQMMFFMMNFNVNDL